MTLITTPELRQMQETAKMMAAFAKGQHEQLMTLMKQQGGTLPPSECAQVSCAISLSIIAACLIKQLEAAEKTDEKETDSEVRQTLLAGT